ncbi:hypothetical protein AQUCO_00200905v1 [Aquilegia coerulea]|uniref:Pentacotripeptide-repeat region of PRORP domain-containing protein n=1 Tax=Aquilegia coerulea TaxID=218851 RepID=A0A2G5F5J0_AQUCA|nr:hypothetical protein AQUCO_00200905v1 [Aquilegia coerulea]PIA63206.1 hypothetical protein AQUCO_00200905v1 [Aquilegia coerulea]
MWKANLFIRYSRQAVPLIRNQVNSKTQTLISSPFTYLSSFLSQNPRFFSIDSNQNFQNAPNIFQEESDYPSVNLFDENPSFISQESETPLANFDGNHGFSSQESETPFASFDGNNGFISQLGVEDENPSFVSQEKVREIDLEKVESVLSILQSNVDGSMENSLDGMRLYLSEEFMVRVIETPLVPGDSLVKIFKWALKKPDFSTTTRILDCLVKAVGSGNRKREVYALWDLVKEFNDEKKCLLTTEILNEFISLFWKLGKGKAGLEVFDKFEEFACEWNADSYYLTIEALCRRKIFDWAWPVCEKMLNAGALPDSEKISNIISCFCKGNKAKDAHLVYLMAKEKKIHLSKSCLNFLITSLCREDDTVKLALDLLGDFSGKDRNYAIKPFSCVVRGLCRIKDTEEVKKLLSMMIFEGPPPGNAVFNFVINAFSKAGEMDVVMGFVKIMESRGLRPDVYTYTVIISGFVKGGEMEEARKVLSEAQKKHSKLCPATFHTLIQGYCKLGEFDKAVELLNVMKESGVEPNFDEYDKMIQSLCLKAVDWRTAEKLLEEMKEKGLPIKGSTKGLVRAVKELEEKELGEEVVSMEA